MTTFTCILPRIVVIVIVVVVFIIIIIMLLMLPRTRQGWVTDVKSCRGKEGELNDKHLVPSCRIRQPLEDEKVLDPKSAAHDWNVDWYLCAEY